MMGFVSIVALFLMGCRTGPAPLPPSEAGRCPRHVVLISLDTVRADALGIYGGSAKTPNIDALAKRGVLFENHLSAAPSTLASHTSLMTGQYPHKHGVPRNAHRLDDRNLMLAEVLDAAGFETAAFLGGMPLGEHANFLQGFDHVDVDFRKARQSKVYEQAERSGDLVTDAVLSWLDSAPDERLFLFVHYFDAHQPYETAVPRESGSLRAVYRLRRQLEANQPAARGISEALKPHYWAEIASVDGYVGRLLDGLKRRGIADDALIILTSDHGESYAEHGEFWDHGMHVYDQTVHTPLLFVLPDAEPARVSTVVSAVDVVPTVLDVLKLPSSPVDGRSLLLLLEGGELPERAVFSEATKPWEKSAPWRNTHRKKMVRLGDLKLVWDPQTDTRQVFNIAKDPGETADLTESPKMEALVRAMDQWVAEADPLPSEKVMAPDITEQLEALGYVD